MIDCEVVLLTGDVNGGSYDEVMKSIQDFAQLRARSEASIVELRIPTSLEVAAEVMATYRKVSGLNVLVTARPHDLAWDQLEEE